MANPLQGMIDKAKQTASGVKSGYEQASGDAAAIKEKMEMINDFKKSNQPARPEAPKPLSKPAPQDLINPAGHYGTGPGEKRIDVSDMVKPLGSMHQGGTVPKTGPYVLKEGEKVLTPEAHQHLKSAMGLVGAALAHDQNKPEPPKHRKKMTIEELHTGGYQVTKHSGNPADEHTVHGAPDNDSVVGHFMDHMGHPDEDEEDVEAGNHDMHGDNASEAEEKAIGLKK